MAARMRLIGTDLPGARWTMPDGTQMSYVHVGLQRGRDPDALLSADASHAVFEVEVTIRSDGPEPDYRGPHIHGQRGDRFIYLTWVNAPGDGTFAMFRRAKLRFATMPGTVIEALTAEDTVTVQFLLTDAHGCPRCARLQPDTITWTL